MNQALYPIDKLEWCVYALFTNSEKKKREYCSINTHKRDANKDKAWKGISGPLLPLNQANANQVSN